MGKLISDVLDLTRGRMGGGIPVVLAREETLRSELEQVVAEMEYSSGKKITVSIDLPQTIFVDAPRIAQLISNLLGNALSHGDPEKPIFFLAGIAEDDQVIANPLSYQPRLNAADNPSCKEQYHEQSGKAHYVASAKRQLQLGRL